MLSLYFSRSTCSIQLWSLYLNESNLSICVLPTKIMPSKLPLTHPWNDWRYLGSYISSSQNDFVTRKGMAWPACDDIHNISQLRGEFELNIFKATVWPILLYRPEMWTLSKRLERMVDGTYTHQLIRAQYLSGKCHPTCLNDLRKLLSDLSIAQARRTQFAGHCYRAKNEVGSSLHSLLSSRGIQASRTRTSLLQWWTGKFGAIMFISLSRLRSNNNDDDAWRETISVV